VRRLPDVPTFDYAFYVASDRFAEQQLEAAVKLVRVIRDTQAFINAHPAETVKLWAAQGGLQPGGAEARVFEQLVREQRLSESTATSLGPVGEAVAKTTQEMADSFHALGLLPGRVDVTGFLLSERVQRPAASVSSALGA
jgi:sulfonate transport system substrate-binding protein